jgi:exonuclease III
MLEEFLHKQDIDIALLQEVTNHNLHSIRRYTAHINQATEGRGTAIMTKVGLSISNIKRLPSGRGMAAIFNGTWIINIYAPSGAEKKTEREAFYTNDITHILPTNHTELILAGDFNCTLDTVDSTGHKNFSRALCTLVSGYRLHDVWKASKSRHDYTHYAPRTASRLDRIYVTQLLLSRKQGVETKAAAFTVHLAVVN